MTILTLRQFLQQQGVEPKEPEYQDVRLVTVRGFIEAIENAYEDDWTVAVTCDYPEAGSLLVRFKPPEDTESTDR